MNKERIAENLLALRGKRTQSEIAELIGVGQSTYAMYETGQRVPSDEVKIRIAKLNKKTVQSIFFN